MTNCCVLLTERLRQMPCERIALFHVTALDLVNPRRRPKHDSGQYNHGNPDGFMVR